MNQIQAQITPLQLRLLEAHYLAPDHTASSEEIALAAENSWRTTNLHYGQLGTKIRRALRQPIRDGDKAQQSSILASFVPPDESFPHYRWIMHSSLAAAIRSLGWFGAEDTGTRSITALTALQSAVEGKQQRKLVLHRQREMSLRRAKLAAFRRDHDGRLFCEVPGCGFDFETTYGELGSGFAEVHHLTPLSERSRPISTRLADLAVVCANCHRMIHRNNGCRTMEGLISKINRA